MPQSDYFLRIDGIDGESTDAHHPGEIALVSWTFGASNTSTPGGGGGGGGGGKATLGDFQFVKATDKASVPLFVACCSGEHLASARLTCRRAGAPPFEYFSLVLSNVVVHAYEAAGSTDLAQPTGEQVTLAYSKIVLDYKVRNPDGSPGADIVGGWDAQLGRKV